MVPGSVPFGTGPPHSGRIKSCSNMKPICTKIAGRESGIKSIRSLELILNVTARISMNWYRKRQDPLMVMLAICTDQPAILSTKDAS